MKIFLCILLSTSFLGLVSNVVQANPPVIGWVERVAVSDQQYRFDAKIDTGADNTSMHVENYHFFERNFVKWVRFTINDNNGKDITLERKLVKITRIKRKLLHAAERPVVRMIVCIGNVVKEVNVNLVNRKKFKHKMLIGRSYLKNTFLVDSGAKNTTEPECQRR